MGNLEDVGREIRRPPLSWRDVLDCKRPGWTPEMVAKEAANLFYAWFVHNDRLYWVLRNRDGADYMLTSWTADDVTRESFRR